MIGAIELGGTKALVAVGTSAETLSEPARIATESPEATLKAVMEVLRRERHGGAISAIGLASFGPLTKSGGRLFSGLANTPKPGWSGVQLRKILSAEFDVPIGIDTDVNGAAMAEGIWGAAQGLSDFAYITAGTGIGVGLVSNGAPVHGMLHPEAGHIRVRRDSRIDPYSGCCPYHGDCLEGLASGTAIRERLGASAEACAEDHPIWLLVGDYLGQLVATLALTASCQVVILGGGVGESPYVLSHVRRSAAQCMAGYLSHPALRDDFSNYIVRPGLGSRSGLLGAFELGRRARSAAF